jgi:hypothetical protein
LAAFLIALQSCTPVFAQSEASRGAASTTETATEKKAVKRKKEAEKKAEPKKDDDKISNSETDKAVFEKKENEPGTWEKVKEKTGDAVEDAVEFGSEQSQKVGRTLGAARTRRQDSTWTFTGNYALFEMWTLTKYGLTVGYNKDESTTYEFEYMRGSLGFGYFGIDLGEISEQRFGLNWRTYGKRNSFSFVTGLYYNMLDMHLGSDALATVAGTQRAKVDLLEIETVGLHWGIGNRWQTKGGFVWGADWIAINLPLWIVKQEHPFIDATTSAKYQDDAKDALRFFRRIPEIAALKIQLGFSF